MTSLRSDGNAGVGIGHRDAAAHGARADDRGLPNWDQRHVLGQARDLGDGALGEEDVDQGFRLVGIQALFEELAFLLAAFVEGEFGGGLHGVDGLERRDQAASALRDRVASCRDGCGVGGRVSQLVAEVARLSRWAAAGRHFAGKGNRAGQQIAVDDAIDNAELGGLGRTDRLAAGAHFGRFGDAGQPRQPLRAARARE